MTVVGRGITLAPCGLAIESVHHLGLALGGRPGQSFVQRLLLPVEAAHSGLGHLRGQRDLRFAEIAPARL
jgi:hypothetical protein